jgi:hypothetical protein
MTLSGRPLVDTPVERPAPVATWVYCLPGLGPEDTPAAVGVDSRPPRPHERPPLPPRGFLLDCGLDGPLTERFPEEGRREGAGAGLGAVLEGCEGLGAGAVEGLEAAGFFPFCCALPLPFDLLASLPTVFASFMTVVSWSIRSARSLSLSQN